MAEAPHPTDGPAFRVERIGPDRGPARGPRVDSGHGIAWIAAAGRAPR